MYLAASSSANPRLRSSWQGTQAGGEGERQDKFYINLQIRVLCVFNQMTSLLHFYYHFPRINTQFGRRGRVAYSHQQVWAQRLLEPTCRKTGMSKLSSPWVWRELMASTPAGPLTSAALGSFSCVRSEVSFPGHSVPKNLQVGESCPASQQPPMAMAKCMVTLWPGLRGQDVPVLWTGQPSELFLGPFADGTRVPV